MSHADSREATSASAVTGGLVLIRQKRIGQTKPNSTHHEALQLDQLELMQHFGGNVHDWPLRSGPENRGNDDSGVTADGQ